MKRLLILRHGTAGAADDDHERPLTAAGIAEATMVGRWLTQTHEQPDCVLASSALRARSTVEHAATAGAWRCETRIVRDLYATSAAGFLAVLRNLPDNFGNVLVAGHEPTCSEVVSALLGSAALLFPPGGIARLDLFVRSWDDLGTQPAALGWFVVPSALNGLS